MILRLFHMNILTRILMLLAISLSASSRLPASIDTINKAEENKLLKNYRLVKNVQNTFIESVAPKLHLGPDAYLRANDCTTKPLGVYALEVNGEIIGLHSLAPYYHGDYLVANAMTDIFSGFRGKGYGTLIRRLAALEAKKAIGKPIFVKSNPAQNEAKLTESHLCCLYSNNEWDYGKNGASTCSAIKAGYGIACIQGGLVKLLYPRNELCWGDKRTEWFLEASRILGNKRAHCPKDAVPFLLKITSDLNLTQQTEVVTLNTLLSLLDTLKKQDSVEYEDSLDVCMRNLSQENLKLVNNYIKGIAYKGSPQKIPTEILNLDQQVNISEKVLKILNDSVNRNSTL